MSTFKIQVFVSICHSFITSYNSHAQAAEQIRKTYEQKCSQLRNRNAKQDGLHAGDRTRAEVKDLHSRILVAIRSAETISERIQKLRDEELQPQLTELLHGYESK